MSKLEDLTDWIRGFRCGKIWINKLVSKQTKRVYLSYFKKFCDAVQKNPDELIQMKLEGMRNVGTQKEFQVEELIEDFLSNPKIYFEKVKDKDKYYRKYAKEGLTNASKVNVKSAVLSFFKHNRRSLESCAEKWRPKEAKSRCPTLKEVEALANNTTTNRDKAIIWLLASAPFREKTLIQLRWNDLEQTQNKEIPIKIVVESARLKGKGKGRYRGLKQVCFLHWYAYKKLKNYRRELLRKLKANGIELSEDMPLFMSYHGNHEPKFTSLSSQRIRDIFEDACLSVWGNLEEKRFSPHDMRDFVNTALINAGVHGESKSAIMGHKIKGVDKHYTDVGQLKLLEKFKKALPLLIPEHKQKNLPQADELIRQQNEALFQATKQFEEITEVMANLTESLLENNEKKMTQAHLQHIKDNIATLKALKKRKKKRS